MARDGDRPPLLRVASLAIRITAGAVTLAVAIGIAGFLIGTRPEPTSEPREESALFVSTVRLEARAVNRAWTGYGVARAMNEADLTAQVSARVVERPESAEGGLPIERDALIVGLDKTDYDAAVQSVQARIRATGAQIEELGARERRLRDQVELAEQQVELAQREYNRVVAAADRGAATTTDLERSESSLRSAERAAAALYEMLDTIPAQRARLEATRLAEQAELRTAAENLARTEIRAPIAGMLQEVFAEPGELLMVGAPVARVVDLTLIEVPLRVPVSAADSVTLGDAVVLRSDSNSAGRWTGTVSRIAPEADAASRTVTLFVEVRQEVQAAIDARRPAPGGEPVLLPGQFVVGEVQTTHSAEVLLVPRSAFQGDRVFMLREQDDGPRAHSVPIRRLFPVEASFPGLHPAETQWVAVDPGTRAGKPVELGVGDRVVISNLAELQEGLLIRAGDATDVFAGGEGASPSGAASSEAGS